MAETYTAWNGDEYPWPPPDGWELKSDGRYWPADQGGEAAAAPAPDPAPVADFTPPPAAPAPGGFDAPAPAPGGFDAPAPGGFAPPPGGPAPAPAPGGFAPPPGAPGGAPAPQAFGGAPGAPGAPGGAPGPGFAGPPPAEKKGLSTGVIVLLAILGVIVLGVIGCVAVVGVAVNEGVDELEDAVENFESAQEAARREISLTDCRVVNGVPQASGTVANVSGGRSDYNVEVIFTGEDGRRLTSGFADVDNVEDGSEVVFDVESFDTDVTTSITCGLGDVTRLASN